MAATNNSNKSSIDEPNVERLQIEMESATSSKPESKDPFLTLPSDIRVKIIGYLPIAQWPSLELVDTNFQSATWAAWRQLRRINLERELLIKYKIMTWYKIAPFESIIHKLVERSPFLTRIDIIFNKDVIFENISDAFRLLAKLEHLQSITVGDAKLYKESNKEELIQLENVVAFLESTRSRMSLKELHLFNVDQRLADRDTILDQFVASFVNGREIEAPLKLEKLSFTSADWALNIPLDTMDAARLTDIRLGRASIEPDQLANLIKRAVNLRGIELSFMSCNEDYDLDRYLLDGNKELLMALASHENLTTIKFVPIFWHDDGVFKWTEFQTEYIEMLKSIGRRGKLRKLAMAERFVRNDTIDWNELCTTICTYIPYLQSIKLDDDYGSLTEESICNIVSLTELEEINFVRWHYGLMATSIKKIAELPRLKRLAVMKFYRRHMNSAKRLANVTTLTDLRISNACNISTGVFDKWSEGFAPNLQILMLRGIAGKVLDAEEGLVRLLEKAGRLRILLLHGRFTDRSLVAIANSCPKLEILGLESSPHGAAITIQCLQEIVDRCPRLNRLGGIGDELRNQLRFSKYRRISDVDTEFDYWENIFDDDEFI